jgi:hypothetical protein
MPRRYGFFTGAAIATALLLATTGYAAAQAAGGRGGGSAPGASDPTAVIVYGTPGNCPPTLAGCNVPDKPKPVFTKKKIDPCGDFAMGSKPYRECKRKQ